MAYPTLNGVAQSWADCVVTAGIYGGLSIDAEDIKDISWKRTLEQGEQRKTGGQLKGKTAGQAGYEASITWYASGYWKMVAALGAAAQAAGYVKDGEVELSRVGFDIVVQHTPAGVDKPRGVEILGCQWTEDGSDMAEGVDADTMSTNPSPRRIVTIDENGLRAVLKG